MNSLSQRLANRISYLLDPAEREAVCGDLAETRSSGPAAFKNILGLVLRRQLALWTNWRPWLALLGIVLLVGFLLGKFLALFATGLFLQVGTYSKYGVHYQTGGVTAARDACHLTIWALNLCAWSWASGFVLASLSRRTLWLTAPLFYIAVQDAFFLYSLLVGSTIIGHPHPPLWALMLRRLLPLNPALLLFLSVAIWGGYRGTRASSLSAKTATAFAALTFALVSLLFWSNGWYETALQEWSGGVLHTAPWAFRLLPLIIASWPAVCMPLLSRRFRFGEIE
ncbi:MAG: hypothetical protein M3Y24_02235 [Acidobacteriota bacterium]|nr:hypothetical protein [Acidobacteriota bacterium]